MNKASTVLSLLNQTGLSIEESADEFDVSKFYVWDNDQEEIVDGPFDTEEDAKKACKGDSQEALPGSEFVGDDEEESDDEECESYVETSADEAAPHKVVSFAGGKKHIKLTCGPGFKLADGKCVKMSAQEIMKRKKSAKIAARKRRGGMKAAMKKRALSMKKRSAAGL